MVTRLNYGGWGGLDSGSGGIMGRRWRGETRVAVVGTRRSRRSSRGSDFQTPPPPPSVEGACRRWGRSHLFFISLSLLPFLRSSLVALTPHLSLYREHSVVLGEAVGNVHIPSSLPTFSSFSFGEGGSQRRLGLFVN